MAINGVSPQKYGSVSLFSDFTKGVECLGHKTTWVLIAGKSIFRRKGKETFPSS